MFFVVVMSKNDFSVHLCKAKAKTDDNYAGKNLKEAIAVAVPSFSPMAAHPVWGLLRGFRNLKGSLTSAQVGERGLCKITRGDKQGDMLR